MENRTVWIWVIIVVLLVALGGWYVLAHENVTATLPTTDTTEAQATTTTPTPNPVVATSTSPAPTSTIDPQTVATNIVGSWRSVDDQNYTIGVTADGKWTDTYKGTDASSTLTQTGTYTIFTNANPDPKFDGTIVPGVVYVKVAEGSTVNYFSVIDASGNDLQLSYLARGNTLAFIRIQ